MNVREWVQTLGIEPTVQCPHCQMKQRISLNERRYLAHLMVRNCSGIWTLWICPECGYSMKMYPSKINGLTATPEICDQLFEEIETYDNYSDAEAPE